MTASTESRRDEKPAESRRYAHSSLAPVAARGASSWLPDPSAAALALNVAKAKIESREQPASGCASFGPFRDPWGPSERALVLLRKQARFRPQACRRAGGDGEPLGPGSHRPFVLRPLPASRTVSRPHQRLAGTLSKSRPNRVRHQDSTSPGGGGASTRCRSSGSTGLTRCISNPAAKHCCLSECDP